VQAGGNPVEEDEKTWLKKKKTVLGQEGGHIAGKGKRAVLVGSPKHGIVWRKEDGKRWATSKDPGRKTKKKKGKERGEKT